jgi:thiosulfate dehydrogenase (quinone) large subunit
MTATTSSSPDTRTGGEGRPGAVGILAGITRLSIGWVFLWAFLDKLFGLGFATQKESAWLEGGSPTEGFLTFGTKGPFKDFFGSFAGAAWADWLFMIGLLGIGLGLMLGVMVRISAWAGALMLMLMYAAAPPMVNLAEAPSNNPFMDDHIVYAVVLLLLAEMGAGRWLGLGGWWERQDAVRKNPVLR